MKDAVSWLACGLLLPGIYFMGQKRWAGFVLAILANVLWITWGVLVHAWAVVAESCFIIAMYARALSTWLAQARAGRENDIAAFREAFKAGMHSAQQDVASGRPLQPWGNFTKYADDKDE